MSAALLSLLLIGCGTPEAGSDSSSFAGVPANSAVVDDQPSQSDPMVGYDLRRLRPRDQEPLAAMFDRLAGEAKTDGKQIVVLFSADWCEPCKHLDLELGNTHPQSMIGGIRIVELKEDDWAAAARMDEYNNLRRRWEPALGSYPLVVLLDDAGARVEEMKEAKDRLEQQGIDATLPVWFASVTALRDP